MKPKELEKKRTKQIKQLPPSTWWSPYALPIVISVVAIVALALLVFLRVPTAGQATLVRTFDPAEPLNLVANQRLQVDIAQVKEWSFTLRPSNMNETENTTYSLKIDDHRDGTITYALAEGDLVDGEWPTTVPTLAIGWLGPALADTRGILVNSEDTQPDLELRFANGIVEMVNARAVTVPTPTTPAGATLQLLRDDVPVGDVFTQLVGVEKQYLVNVILPPGSSVVGVRTTQLNGQQTTPQPEAIPIPGGNPMQFTYRLTPSMVGPQTLSINVIVQDGAVQTAFQKDFTLAGDGLVYRLSNDPQYPGINLTLLNEATKQARVDYLIQNIPGKQPFSLPCSGVISLESLTVLPVLPPGTPPSTTPLLAGQLFTVASYDAQHSRAQGWREGVPSEFTQLQPLKGYSLQLLNTNTPWKISVECTLSKEFPSLIKGWNLVAISGFTAVTRAELNLSKAPPATSITSMKELQKDDSVSGEKDKLQPGKAYWVLVE